MRTLPAEVTDAIRRAAMRYYRDVDGMPYMRVPPGSADEPARDAYIGRDFIDYDMSEMLLDSHEFIDCRFWYSWLPMDQMSRRVGYVRCDFHAAAMYGNVYQECCYIGSSFNAASITCCDFDRCDFRRADFAGADLSGSRFYRCDFREAGLSGANLSGCVFTDCAFLPGAFDKALGEGLDPKWCDEEVLALFEARDPAVKATPAPLHPFKGEGSLSSPFVQTCAGEGAEKGYRNIWKATSGEPYDRWRLEDRFRPRDDGRDAVERFMAYDSIPWVKADRDAYAELRARERRSEPEAGDVRPVKPAAPAAPEPRPAPEQAQAHSPKVPSAQPAPARPSLLDRMFNKPDGGARSR